MMNILNANWLLGLVLLLFFLLTVHDPVVLLILFLLHLRIRVNNKKKTKVEKPGPPLIFNAFCSFFLASLQSCTTNAAFYY